MFLAFGSTAGRGFERELRDTVDADYTLLSISLGFDLISPETIL